MELLYSLDSSWEPIPDKSKRWSRKPDADEVADGEKSSEHWIERVVTERWGYAKLDPFDEDHPEAHGYYLISEPDIGQSTLRIYYRHWESDAPITERVSMLIEGGSTGAQIAYREFLTEKSLALLDFELRDEEYLQLVSEIRELELEEHSSLTFKFGDVTGCWVPFPWNIVDGRFYIFRDGHRITKSGEDVHFDVTEFPTTNTNLEFCKRADAEKYFQDLCRPGNAD